jgi:hypothetical protein
VPQAVRSYPLTPSTPSIWEVGVVRFRLAGRLGLCRWPVVRFAYEPPRNDLGGVSFGGGAVISETQFGELTAILGRIAVELERVNLVQFEEEADSNACVRNEE